MPNIKTNPAPKTTQASPSKSNAKFKPVVPPSPLSEENAKLHDVLIKALAQRELSDRKQKSSAGPGIVIYTNYNKYFRLNIGEITQFLNLCFQEQQIEDPNDFYELINNIEAFTLDVVLEEHFEKSRVQAIRFIRSLNVFLTSFVHDAEII